VSKARLEFADTVSKVAYSGDWVILQKHGRDVAGLVPASALQSLVQLLDATRTALERGTIDEGELGSLMGWKESEFRAARRRASLAHLARFFLKAWDVTGSLPACQRWLRTPVPVLGHRSPKQVVLSEGLRRVNAVLSEVEAGPAL
jgi:uncharacterized protein (DUF2384 family)